eukprot:gene4057-4399_t
MISGALTGFNAQVGLSPLPESKPVLDPQPLLSELTRGNAAGRESLGALFESHWPTIPSHLNPTEPVANFWYTGGHIVERHGSSTNWGGEGGAVAATQIEFPGDMRWDRNGQDHLASSDALAELFVQWFETWHGIKVTQGERAAWDCGVAEEAGACFTADGVQAPAPHAEPVRPPPLPNRFLEIMFERNTTEAPLPPENPDYGPVQCHTAVQHITDVESSEGNGRAWAFVLHLADDCEASGGVADRQRNEIKAYNKSPPKMLGFYGDQVEYTWKFKIAARVLFSSKFTHLFQIKMVGGSNSGAPLFTLTPVSKGSGDYLEVRHQPEDTS